MNRHTIITTKRALRITCLWVSLLFSCALSNLLIAHGGFDHVIGTVLKMERNVLTVRTAKGNVDVKLNDKTEITKGDQKVQVMDLKPGTRVVVDVLEDSKDRIAHSVKVGVSGTADIHPHGTK
jgi:hypothetical protein